MLVFITFKGLRVSGVEAAARGVLPHHYAAGVRHLQREQAVDGHLAHPRGGANGGAVEAEGGARKGAWRHGAEQTGKRGRRRRWSGRGRRFGEREEGKAGGEICVVR